MSRIILYTIGCPLCDKLEQKLNAANIQYELNTDEKEMESLGFETVPMLAVDGQYLEFGEAVNWIKETTK